MLAAGPKSMGYRDQTTPRTPTCPADNFIGGSKFKGYLLNQGSLVQIQVGPRRGSVAQSGRALVISPSDTKLIRRLFAGRRGSVLSGVAQHSVRRCRAPEVAGGNPAPSTKYSELHHLPACFSTRGPKRLGYRHQSTHLHNLAHGSSFVFRAEGIRLSG